MIVEITELCLEGGSQLAGFCYGTTELFSKDLLSSEKFSSNSVCQGIRTKIQSEFSWVFLYIASSEDKFYFTLVVNDEKEL